jgi:thiol-disulfide isomerase/thioredoxin
MKKILFITIAILTIGYLCYQLLYPSKNSPLKFSTTTSRNIRILKVHQNEFDTRIDFKVDAYKYKSSGFMVSSEGLYIQNSNGGDKIKLLGVEGIELDKEYKDTIFENIRYTIIFPSIDKSVKTIDFISENIEIYDIELVPQENTTIIPEEFQGNWLKTDGSNQWAYGFYDNIIIYKNKFWNIFNLKKSKKLYTLTIEKDGVKHQINIKKTKNDNLLIGENKGNLKLLSREKTNKNDFELKNERNLKTDIFKEGVAIYKGYIKGYHPKMNWVANVNVNDVITHNNLEYTFKVNEDGTFYAEIPLNYAQRVYTRIGKLYGTFRNGFIDERVLLEPNKTTIQFIDLSEHNAPYKDFKQYFERERKSKFMGDLSQLNSELENLESIRYFDNEKIRNEILDMTPNEYKRYCLGVMKQEQDSLKEYVKNNKINDEAARIKGLEISLSASDNILRIELNKRSASLVRKRSKITDKDLNKRESFKEDEKLTSDYFDFLNWEEINNPSSLITGREYSFLISELRFGPQLIEFGKFHNYFDILIKNIKERDIKLSQSEKKMLEALVKCKSTKEVRNITRKNGGKIWNSFKDKHSNVYNESIYENTERTSSKNRENLYGMPKGFASEVLFAQKKADIINKNKEPFNKWHLSSIAENISDENLKKTLLKYNQFKKLEFANDLEKSNFILHETPNVKIENLFYEIKEKYKGKIVFIDFWATWCGPCLAGIERAKLFKKKLKGKEIEFIYITGNTSPLRAYDKITPGIEGNHYRLNKEQWEFLVNGFNITGIPRYMFIDKQGNIVSDNLKAPFISGEFNKLLLEYL